MTAPSLATRVRRALDAIELPIGAPLLVACSGGLDSQVLLDVVAHVARARDGVRRVVPFAHGVDHGLRAEAASELALAAELAHARDVPFTVSRLAVEPGSNLQARARAARLRALRGAAQQVGARAIATAHHLEDRAETVMIRILRGAPLQGLAVLPLGSHGLVRPLIEAHRIELERHATRRGLAFARDPSNADRRHLRTRVRHEVLPLLRSLDPRIDEHLVRLAEDALALPVDATAKTIAALLGTHPSHRAVQAASRAAYGRDRRARVALPGDRTLRWDPQHGFVISASSPTRG